jgi:HK97 family phage major capsid protein
MRQDEFLQLKEQRQTLAVELRSFTDQMHARREENGGEYLVEDEQERDRREAELIQLNKVIETERRTLDSTQWSDSSVTVSKDGAPASLAEYRNQTLSARKLQGAGPSNVTQPELDAPEYRTALYNWVVNGREGVGFEEYRVLSKGASGGGFFVPTDMADNIVRALRFLPGGVTAASRNVSTSTGETINIPRNLTHGTAAWIAESGSYTPSDETITQGTISAFKAGTKIIVSEELLTDSSFDLEPFISTEFGERIGALAEDAYINGDGAGKPTGLLDAASGLTVYTLPAGQVTTLTAAAILTALFQVPAQYRSDLAILVSDSLFVRLFTLVDSTGRPLWAQSLASGAPDTLGGLPIFTHPNLPASGANAKSMIVGDFGRGYLIRRVNGIYMQRQNELHSDSGQVGFRAYLRLDGKAQLADAMRVVAFAAT